MAVSLSNRPEFVILVVASAACGAVLTTCNPNYTVGKSRRSAILRKLCLNLVSRLVNFTKTRSMGRTTIYSQF